MQRASWTAPLACLILGSGRLCAQSAAPESAGRPLELPQITIISTTPIGNTGIALDKYPGNATIINNKDLAKDALSFPDLLDERMGSVNVNDTQGNRYQVDLNYRGFTASPVLGTAQGLSVFLDGVRINEPFGDAVSWDLIPQSAIANVTVIPGSNSVFGLNTLGGALALNTKSGFAFPGAEAKLSAGSFQRRTLDVEQGGHSDNEDYYIAASIADDDGWAAFNPSKLRQLFGKVGVQNHVLDVDLSLMYADDTMYGNQSVPASMLSNARAGYSHPDFVQTRSYMLNLKGSYELDEFRSASASSYYRRIERDILNSNIDETIPESAANSAACSADPVAPDCPARNFLASYDQHVYGLNFQWSTAQPVMAVPQRLVAGATYEHGNATFNNTAHYAYVDSSNATVDVGSSLAQSAIGSNSLRYGVFATDTAELTERFSLTASARYDLARVELAGWTCKQDQLCDGQRAPAAVTSVTGSHTYQRFNPSVGGVFAISPRTTAYASYSDGFRTPSAIELACADKDNPCSGVPNAFGADPSLKAVVSRTFEIGLRGSRGDAVRWRGAMFLASLHDDIVFNYASATLGYFSNVGQTRRRGVEFGVDGKTVSWDYALSTSWIDATYRTPFTLANAANSTCDRSLPDPCAAVSNRAGDRIPGIPAFTLKFNLGYALSQQIRLSAGIHLQGPQFARGDENNGDSHGEVPGFTAVKLNLDYRIGERLESFVGVNNLFNRLYATSGLLGANNLVTGGPSEQFRGVAAPRAYYAGLRARF
jgi:iron complex outermembrane recepter protein